MEESKFTDIHFRDEHGLTRLHLAAKDGDLILVERLLQNGANPNSVDNCSWTPLHYAMWSPPEKGDLYLLIVKCLLKAGANPNPALSEGLYTPLHQVVHSNKLLLEKVLSK